MSESPANSEPPPKNPLRSTVVDSEEYLKTFFDSIPGQQALKHFSSIKDSSERIQFCVENEQFQKAANHVIDELRKKLSLEEKDRIVAGTFRLRGNDLFKKKHYEDAIDYYTKSIVFAPNDSPELSMAIANRSAAYLHLGYYEQTLKDIDYAIKSDYQSPYKLEVRRARALSSMGRHYEARMILGSVTNKIDPKDKQTKEEVAKLLGTIPEKDDDQVKNKYASFDDIKWEINGKPNTNPELRLASDAVALEFDPNKGRTLIAARDIETDEVVLTADPFAAILRSTKQSKDQTAKCEYCFRSLELMKRPPIACRNCVHVAYCSLECESKSWTAFHERECGLMRAAMKWAGDEGLSARTIFRSGVNQAMTKFRETDDTKSDGDDYHQILSLMDHESDFDAKVLLSKSLKACFLMYAMNQSESVGDYERSKPNSLTLAQLLLKHMLQIVINGMYVTAEKDVDEKKILFAETANAEDLYGDLVSEMENVGIALYPCLSLLNHSCDPNLYQRGGRRVVVQAMRPIKAGEELTITYGPVARAMPKAERQKQLMDRYFFKCTCVACSTDYYEVASAFKCPDCQGPVHYDIHDKSNRCARCGKEGAIDLDKVIKVRDYARSLVIQGMASMVQAGQKPIMAALEKLNKAYELLNHVLYEQNRELGIVATEITLCYTRLGQYGHAEKFARRSAQIICKLYGADSYQYAVELMRLTELQRTRIQSECPIKDMNERYWNEATETLQEAINIYEKHVGKSNYNRDSYHIRKQQLKNLIDRHKELVNMAKDCNSIDYAVGLLKHLREQMRSSP